MIVHSIVASKTRALFWSTLVSAALVLAGCGGGGNDSTPAATANTGGGGGGNVVAPSTGSAVVIAAAAANVLPMTVSPGLISLPNIPTVSVQVCVPGTTQCQTVTNVQVDTGSSGLRILASALTSTTGFPQVNVNNAPLGECQLFADGYTWGSVRTADVKLSGESALATPIQLVSDPSFANVPSSCLSQGGNIGTAAGLGVNGILGVGVMPQDCGTACATVSNTLPAVYYTCPSGACTKAVVPLTQQISNPVTKFAVDNNGVILQLPAVPVGGSTAVSGALVFGIGTATNNAFNSGTQLLQLNSSGNFSTSFNGTSYTSSFLDSGSNGLFFNDTALPTCSSTSQAPGFYCPTASTNFSAVLTGTNSVSSTVPFVVSNASTLASSIPSGKIAFSDLAGGGVVARSFDWGLPFFFGRDVYTAISGATTPNGTGPYIAY
jgi:hypothetical protein